MAIQILKRPYERCWSGNPIHYTLFSSSAEADARIYFQVRIMFKRMDYADYVEAITLPYTPVSGTSKVDIQSILDGLLEYELPMLPADDEFNSILLAKKMTGHFYIDVREITPDDDDPDWESDIANELFVIKGGISFEKWRGDNYWVNYFDVVMPFLTWQESGREKSLTERMYLAWLNDTDADPSLIKMARTIHYTDGTEDLQYLDCVVPARLVCYFPSGASQLELADVNPDKTIYWWQLQLVTYSTNPLEPLSMPFRFYADNRNDYNAVTLNYRSSLGGIDSARIRGVIDYTAQREFTQQERVVLHDYFSEHFINGRIVSANSTELQVMKGDTGHLGKEEQDRLRDMHLKRECWQEKQLKWLPVVLLTGTQRIRLSTDKLFSMPVEFAIAKGSDEYYTPDNINLQEGNSFPLVCNSVIDNLASSLGVGGYEITWDLISGAPVRYELSTPGVSGGAWQSTLVTNFTYPWLPVGDSVISIRPICLIGGVEYPGAIVTITVTVPAVCIPVSISSPPIYMPDAIEDTPYSFNIYLAGTAPFNISNIVKPAWMSLAIAGNTVEITGTPTAGDIGTDIDVSFDLDNCSGGSTASYADTIDVIDLTGNGEFILRNAADIFTLCVIKQVLPLTPPFYSFTVGSTPVTPGQMAEGFLTMAISGPVTVRVIIDSPGFTLRLLKNGVLQQEIPTPSSGLYSFDPVAFLITDDMEIILSII